MVDAKTGDDLFDATCAAVYALLTLLLRCWSREDIEHLMQLHRRIARGRPQALVRLLAWSGRIGHRELS